MVSSSLNDTISVGHFCPEVPRPWMGRYNRIPGEASVFHIRFSRVVGHFWPLALSRINGEILEYLFADCSATRTLTAHICRLQQRINGFPGGSFVINEYGQVLVPDTNEYRSRYYVGRLIGDWKLRDPENLSRLVSLDADVTMRCGDVWARPYVGVPYRLSRSDRIYFVQRLPDGEKILYPRKQDLRLIALLRRLRKWGPMSFIVNPFGVVLTKQADCLSSYEEVWTPVFVGRVDYSTWFEREEV